MLDAIETWLPRSLRTRTAVVVRDARMIAGRLRGDRPPPFHVRGGGPAIASSITFRRARVVEVTRETDDAVSLVLEDESGRAFDHSPGQFLTLVVDPGAGEPARRAYSIAWSSGDRRRVAIGIKRVPGGLVSTHLVERIQPGDRLQVLGPSGSFGPATGDGPVAVLIGGGSGITPLLRIAAHLLETRADGRVALVLANRRPADVMFRARLARLAADHPSRLSLVHVHDEPGEDEALRGPLSGDVLLEALARLPFVVDGDVTFHVCGPSGMMDAARGGLAALGIAPARVREERFATAERQAPPVSPQRVTFRLPGGRAQEVVARPGATLLEAGLEAGLPMAYSCTLGGCGACKLRVSGPVAMAEPSCLSAEERAAGEVLACVATACGHVTVEVP